MPGNLTVYTALAFTNGAFSIGANTLGVGGTEMKEFLKQ
jgi:hypothetical protein